MGNYVDAVRAGYYRDPGPHDHGDVTKHTIRDAYIGALRAIVRREGAKRRPTRQEVMALIVGLDPGCLRCRFLVDHWMAGLHRVHGV